MHLLVYNKHMIAINVDKTIAFTGHRILEDPKEVIEKTVSKAVMRYVENGFDTFLCGMAPGFDLLCGEIINSLKKDGVKIRLVCCIPYENSKKSFTKKDKVLFDEVAAFADDTVILSKNYYNGCFHARDKFMVDNASVVISYKTRDNSGTGFTTAYAAMLNKKILDVKALIDNGECK